MNYIDMTSLEILAILIEKYPEDHEALDRIRTDVIQLQDSLEYFYEESTK